MPKYLVNFIYPHTILMATVETDLTDEWQIAEEADVMIFEDIGFAPLLGADDWTVEELN
jgi:hypothetical protein